MKMEAISTALSSSSLNSNSFTMPPAVKEWRFESIFIAISNEIFAQGSTDNRYFGAI